MDEEDPQFNPLMDPKCCWAVRHLELFPVEVNKASFEMLLRVPGIARSAPGGFCARGAVPVWTGRICGGSGWCSNGHNTFCSARGKRPAGLIVSERNTVRALIDGAPVAQAEQLSLFGDELRRPQQLEEAATECFMSGI